MVGLFKIEGDSDLSTSAMVTGLYVLFELVMERVKDDEFRHSYFYFCYIIMSSKQFPEHTVRFGARASDTGGLLGRDNHLTFEDEVGVSPPIFPVLYASFFFSSLLFSSLLFAFASL